MRHLLALDKDDFYLLGQSWGGILAIEYALKYQRHLKGQAISNMMASIPACNEYADRVLMPAMDQAHRGQITVPTLVVGASTTRWTRRTCR